MRSRFLFAGAALVCTAPAVSCWRHRARRDHVDNSIAFLTKVATQPVIDWHIMLGDQHVTATTIVKSTTSATTGSATSAGFVGTLHKSARVAGPDVGDHRSTIVASSTQIVTSSSKGDPTVADHFNALPLRSVSSSVRITPENLIPNGKKAGLSGYVGIEKLGAFSKLAPYISWYSDYTPDPPTIGDVLGVGMLWGANGSPCGNEVNKRLSAFKKVIELTSPGIMFGFYEPDCYCADSSEMSASSGTSQWNELLAPLGKQGTILGSPSMCKQKDEDWLQPFAKGGLDHDWHVTSVHINKADLDGIKEDIEYYASKYGKPIWVSEFACVHDKNGWNPCTDQEEIDNFINDAVEFFEKNDTVVAYGPSNGNGLGNTWPLTDAVGDLTESGQTYLNAIKRLA